MGYSLGNNHLRSHFDCCDDADHSNDAPHHSTSPLHRSNLNANYVFSYCCYTVVAYSMLNCCSFIDFFEAIAAIFKAIITTAVFCYRSLPNTFSHTYRYNHHHRLLGSIVKLTTIAATLAITTDSCNFFNCNCHPPHSIHHPNPNANSIASGVATIITVATVDTTATAAVIFKFITLALTYLNSRATTFINAIYYHLYCWSIFTLLIHHLSQRTPKAISNSKHSRSMCSIYHKCCQSV